MTYRAEREEKLDKVFSIPMLCVLRVPGTIKVKQNGFKRLTCVKHESVRNICYLKVIKILRKRKVLNVYLPATKKSFANGCLT